MKRNIIYYSFIILALSLLFSCKKSFLNSKYDGVVSPDTYPVSANNLEALVTGLYGMTNQMYYQAGDYSVCLGGDDATTLSGGNKGPFLEFDLFDADDNNSANTETWIACYAVIKQSNEIINNTNSINDETVSATQLQDLKNRSLGQAYFLRALAYFDLVRTYGQVPLVTVIEVNYTAKKAAFTDIYDTIASDLHNAEVLLPAVWANAGDLTSTETSTEYARPSSGSAKSLLASVYLTMAGYPIKNTSYYALAAAKAKEVLDSESVYGYQLLSEDQLWNPNNGWKTTANAEGVFTVFYNENSSGNCMTSSQQPSEMSGWNDYFAEYTFYNEFPAGARKTATFIDTVVTAGGTIFTPYTGFASKHPHYRKLALFPQTDMANMDAYIDWWSSRTIPVIRYAETLLVYAEAEAMADGTPNSLAYTCLNRVRERAGENDMVPGLTGTVFLDSVINERKWEFAGLEPNARWFDLIRTETVAAANAKRSPNDIPLIGAPNDASHTDYFAPIPLADKELDPNLNN